MIGSTTSLKADTMRREHHDLLRLTTSERAVVQLARSYLSEWSPADLASIPEACRPGKVLDAEEIADLAYALTRSRIESLGPQPLLEEMEGFFARACARLSELETPSRLPPRSYLTR
jgi:hypothetical protein